MTRTDVYFQSTRLHSFLDKTETTEDEIEKMHEYVGKQAEILDMLWVYMIQLDESINKLKEDQTTDTMREAMIKILSSIRDDIATKFGEKDRYK